MCKSVVGLKFNKLTILEDLGKKVRCSCECGGEKIAQKGHVTNNLTTSCGCAKRKGNLVGQTFSYLTVVGFEKNSGYICKCKCGATTISSGRKLELGQKKSCGKCNCKAEDLEKLIIGQTFQELTVISEAENKYKNKQRCWNCKCSCGKDLVLSTAKLKIQESCGCKNIAHVHDGLAAKYSHIYKKWFCYKKDNILDEHFSEFKNFLDYVINELGDRKREEAILIPIDRDKLISVGNLKWKYNHFVQEFCGIEYKWCGGCDRFVQNTSKFWPKRESSSCKKCGRMYVLKKHYNIEYGEYLDLIKKCNRRCLICKSDKRLCVDHCHTSGKVRGILCSTCNSALGQFKDNIEHMKLAVDYLKNSITDIKYNVTKSKHRKVGQTCKITNGDERLVVDHCHKTGFVRGVIQNNINSGIGLFKEDANLIEKAILYLSEALCHS